MADLPIPFKAPMVRALLAGTKTQTRRVLKPQPAHHAMHGFFLPTRKEYTFAEYLPVNSPNIDACTPHEVGGRLWVREAITASGALIQYVADHKTSNKIWPAHWRRFTAPAIHMPRWASRLTLTVTDVRVQRLQEISDEGAEAEGCPPCRRCGDCGWINEGPHGGWQCDEPGCGDAYVDQYARLWSHINGPGAWEANPWVAAYTFTVEHRNIDAPSEGGR